MTTVLNDRPNRSVENRQMEEAWKIRTIDKQRLKDSDQKQKAKWEGQLGRGGRRKRTVHGGRRGTTKLCGAFLTCRL